MSRSVIDSLGVIGLLTLAPMMNAANVDTPLETILVTASRDAQPGSEVNGAWSVLSDDETAFTRLQHSNQLFQRVPGAWISRGNGQESLISLRSPVLTGAGSCGAFVTAEDSISLRAPGFCNVNQLFDANLLQAGSVEVLRGPDSGVFGSNAMHGVINVLTRNAAQTINRLGVEAGSRDFYRSTLSVASSDHGIAFNGQITSYGGFQSDSGYDQQKFTIRWDDSRGPWAMTAALSGSNLNQETAGFIRGFESYRDENIRAVNPNPEAYRDARSFRGYLRGERALSSGRTLTLTLYGRHNDMTFLQHFLPWQATEHNCHHSLGVQTAVSGTNLGFSWQSGLDVDATRGSLLETQDEPFSPNQPQGVHYDYEVDALTTAAYLQVTRPWGHNWQLSGAARLEATYYTYDNQTDDGSACAPTATACRFFRPGDRDDHFSNWTGNIGIIRSVGQQQFYGRLARGFRAPQSTELYRLQGGQQVADIGSEAITSVEVGSRGTLFDTVSYSVNAYAMQKTDVIFQNADRFNVSGAETDHRGVELESTWRINSVFSADVAASYADHSYVNAVNLLGTSSDISGNTIDTAPRHFGSLRVRSDFGAKALPLTAELEMTWLASYFLDPANAHEYDGHTLLNLRANYAMSPGVDVGLVITNLTDRAYAERADFGFGSYRYFPGEPRTALVSLSIAL